MSFQIIIYKFIFFVVQDVPYTLQTILGRKTSVTAYALFIQL